MCSHFLLNDRSQSSCDRDFEAGDIPNAQSCVSKVKNDNIK